MKRNCDMASMTAAHSLNRVGEQRIMRASHLRRLDLTALYEVCCQTVVFPTGTTKYAAETCRALKRVVETTADCVRTGEPTA
jgi:hypothetical protein